MDFGDIRSAVQNGERLPEGWTRIRGAGQYVRDHTDCVQCVALVLWVDDKPHHALFFPVRMGQVVPVVCGSMDREQLHAVVCGFCKRLADAHALGDPSILARAEREGPRAVERNPGEFVVFLCAMWSIEHEFEQGI